MALYVSKNIVGDKKGFLKIFEISPRHSSYSAYCDCGNLVEGIQIGKWNANTMMFSCGCQRNLRVSLGTAGLAVGDANKDWTIVGFIEAKVTKKIIVKCKCGHIQNISSYEFKRKDSSHSCKSCYLSTKQGLKKMQDTARKSIYYRYQAKAKANNLEFSLSFEEFVFLIGNNCYYSGHAPSNIFKDYRTKREIMKYSGIDRKDNTQGYSVTNTVPCCEICNKAKRNMSFDLFIDWLEDTVRFRSASYA